MIYIRYGLEQHICTREKLLPEKCFPVRSQSRNHEERSKESVGAQFSARKRNRTCLPIRIYSSPRQAYRSRGRYRLFPRSSAWHDRVLFELDSEYPLRRGGCKACSVGTHKHRRTGRSSDIRRDQHRMRELLSVPLISFTISRVVIDERTSLRGPSSDNRQRGPSSRRFKLANVVRT
jgi:hypothetical protein